MGSAIKRIPSLDGLRAISVLLVIVSHSNHTIRNYVDIGNLGVRMFFIISSYLITGILYRDVIKNRLNLKTFYFKRIMRTFAAFYFFLGVLVIVLLLFGLFDWEQFWRAPIYLENYHPRNLWNTKQWFAGHTWSLAVEEQFYLLIAALIYLFHKKIISEKGVIRFFIGITILVPIIRIGYFRVGFSQMFSPGHYASTVRNSL
jgi:peptidoglycan/LPS O-acetylase OafA/YrhL